MHRTNSLRGKLYETEDAAFDAHASGSFKDDSKGLVASAGGEQVEVMAYYCHGSSDVSWQSTADRTKMVLTGPVNSMEDDHDDSGPDGVGGVPAMK